MWPAEVKEKALSACGRRCCICHSFCGVNIELHHIKPEADDGPSSLENCIPLCFKCHADVGHYNDRHPKGTKYRQGELRRHRDAWFLAMAGAERLKRASGDLNPALPDEVFEGQELQFRGHLSRQTFAGPPNYDDFRTDELETIWLLTLPHPVRFNYDSLEPTQDNALSVPNAQVVHLMLSQQQYAAHESKVNGEVYVTGRLWPCTTGHHRGDFLLEVSDILAPDHYLTDLTAENEESEGHQDTLIIPNRRTPRNLITFLDFGTPKTRVIEVLGTPDRIDHVPSMEHDHIVYRFENTQVEIGFEDGVVSEMIALLVVGKTWTFDIDGLATPLTLGQTTMADVLKISPETRIDYSPGNHAILLTAGLPIGPSGGWDMHWFGAIHAPSKAGALHHVDFIWDNQGEAGRTPTSEILINWVGKTKLNANAPLFGWHIR